jgi:uncharacterized protein (TIGR02145 family)
MKKILYLALTASALFTACSKKSNTQPTPVATSVVIGGTTYPTVVIGTQTWTAVNYNGPGGENYNNSATNIPANGKLYTLAEAQAVTLPAGWELPTAADYNLLLKNIGGALQTTGDYSVNPTIALELMSTSGWTTGANGNNQLGFNAQPVGDYDAEAAQFLRAGTDAFFMINNTGAAIYDPLSVDVSQDQTEVAYFFGGLVYRLSVRFVKNN